jgi:PhzF family phenazine biosynthesis protein
MKTFFVDSFTEQKFKGNPAAVCLAETELSNVTMQDIATEIGFSETAFIKQITGIYL